MNKLFDNIEGFLFDLDGTLVDSMWVWSNIDKEFLAKFNLDAPKSIQHKIEGLSFVETAVFFKTEFNIEWSIEQIMECWNDMAMDKYKNEVPLKRGAFEFVKKAYEKGIKIAIASSNSRELIETVLKAQGINQYISSIVCATDVKKGKPEPDVYIKAAENITVPCNKCIVFEDIVPGIIAGKRAGMKVIAMEDAYSLQKREEKEQAADYYAESFEELM